MSEEQKETAPTKEEFFKLADEWARATGHHSNSHIIMRHEAARKIAAMGKTAIPWILLRLSSNHGFFHAHLLEEITGERPYPPQERIGDTGWIAFNVQQVIDAWKDWGRQKGLLPPCQPRKRK
jgi:hypothetical protein